MKKKKKQCSSIAALPTAYLQRLQAIVPPCALPNALASVVMPRGVGLRVNEQQQSLAETETALSAAGFHYQSMPGYPSLLLLPAQARAWVLAHPAYKEGAWYLQNPSSALAPCLLSPEPGHQVLDLAAAPGSKTSQIAMMMQGQGYLAAVEKNRSRFFKMKANLKHLGFDAVRLFMKDGRTVWRHCEARFDRVLVDAPCSSEGRFHLSNQETLNYWQVHKSKQMVQQQWPLLASGFRCLKPGGRLLYATCTLAPEENEAVVARLLARHTDAMLLPIHCPGVPLMPGLTHWQSQTWPQSMAQTVRVLPDRQWDSFYCALLTRR